MIYYDLFVMRLMPLKQFIISETNTNVFIAFLKKYGWGSNDFKWKIEAYKRTNI